MRARGSGLIGRHWATGQAAPAPICNPLPIACGAIWQRRIACSWMKLRRRCSIPGVVNTAPKPWHAVHRGTLGWPHARNTRCPRRGVESVVRETAVDDLQRLDAR